ncbi:LemA family protein [Clostridium swellfunianum]|uniref:LemA family protein n=1 Tax=Clostridium swellfunianum TaxID=1367462 RepID=UPI00202E6108|nr:LemA family protein [Clostridium swellfunianum]MCM0648354.1 LemA family protein [Clostridium swellfunianum]
MSKTLKTILIIVGILILLIVPIAGSYNKLVGLEQSVKTSEAAIDVNLQRRNDLIPNLVETVKGYAAQEKDILTEIANARSRLGGAQSVQERADADNQLSGALSRLLVVVERYPELKSNQNFRDLSVALEGTENRIAISRQDYNKSVDAYNTAVRRFPTTIVANLFRFEQKPYYRAAEGAREVPKVDFNTTR